MKLKKLFNILLVLLLSMGIFTFNRVKVEAYDGSETDTTGWILGWTHFGTGGNVEFAIDPNETLWIRPENGASTGTMGSYSATNNSGSLFYNYRNNITSVKIKANTSVVAPSNCSYMFNSIGKQDGIIDTTGLDTSNVTNMSSMFYNSRTTTLDVSNFKTSNVTNMRWMFCNSQANSLDLSNFDTSSVTDISNMFYNSKATTINGLENIDTSKALNMGEMFAFSAATTLDLSNFDTSNVTSMFNMFLGIQAQKVIFSGNMLGKTGNEFKTARLGYTDWVKVRDSNGNILFDETEYTGEQIMGLNESTTPTLSGTWMRKTSPEYATRFDDVEYISKQGINANNEWVKDGDTWTYTFDVFDDSIPYYIWEDKIPGYTSSVMKPDKDLMNQNGEKYYEIINRSTTLGSLNITKTTDTETEDRFEFTITLNGNGLEGTKVFSNVIFTDGVGKIKLGKGENKLIEGLPSGVTYTVEETPYSDYTTTSIGETGTIVANETQEVSFYNKENVMKDLTAESGFKVKKVVEGNNDEVAETFDFIAQINAGEPNKLINLSNGESITTDASGLAIYEFSLANNEELIFSNLSTGATYQVTEKAGEYISSYSIQDLNEGNSINQSANENTTQNLALSTAVETLDIDEEIEITFTNKIIKIQNLKVAKQVIGNSEDKDKQYEITVELYGLDPMATLDSDAGRFVADEDGYAIKTILLRDGEEFMIPEIPVGTQYVITESPNNTYAAYEITDVNGGSDFVKSADSNNDINLRLATQMETVNENEEATIKFINTSQVTLKLEKVVDGNMGNKEDEFEFDVKVWKDTPDTEYINLSNYGGVLQGSGIYRFTLKHGDNIDIVKIFPGYNYEITEVDYSNEGYRTYTNNSMIQGRTISGVLNTDTNIKVRNIRGAAVPTEIRFWWWSGIPLVLGPLLWFIIKRRKKKIERRVVL